MTDDSTLAKLLADALAKADDLQRQLAAADARAAHYERLAQQHETRLRDAADVWQALERTLQHTRSELGRVLPPDVAATSTPTTRAIALSRIPTQATLPPPVPVKAISFPSLPPPPLPNPRNSQLLQTAAPVVIVPVSQTPVARPVATTSAAVLAQRKERARFSDSPPPFAGAAAAESRKRKRDDDLEEELVATVDGTGDDSVSEMSLDDMILAVSGEEPTHGQQAVPQLTAAAVSSAGTSPAPQPPRKKQAQSSSVSSMPTASSANPTSASANGPAQPTGQALYPSHNAQGQRQCRACGQAGRYKDGKCVEKWGPGPAGPGTVCDRCRKKMKRVERRDLAPAAAAAQVPRTTASPTISSPVPAAHAPSSPVCTSATVTAAASPNVRPSTAETMRPASADSGLHQVAKHLEFKTDLRPTSAPTPVHQLPSPAQSIDHDREVLPAPRERGFYDAARERRVSTEHDERERERRQTSAERDERLDSPLTSGPLSHFGTSSRGSPAFSSSAMEHGHRLEQPPSLQPALSHFGHSSASGFSGYRSQDIMPLPSRSSFAAITGLHRDSYAGDRSASSYVRSPMPRFAYEPPTSSLRSSGPWGGKHDEVEPVA